MDILITDLVRVLYVEKTNLEYSEPSEESSIPTGRGDRYGVC